MSDWPFLEKHRVTTPTRSVHPHYVSDSSFGFAGMFRFIVDGKAIRCIASDGMDWQHVSVSIEGDRRTPSWGIMCKVKDLFWDEEEWVAQFHPAHSEYVNFHPGCLHLWRPTKEKMPTPSSLMVGPKTKQPVQL